MVILVVFTWLFVGSMSYMYGVKKFDAPYYGFGHFLLWMILGPVGLYLNIKDKY